jgi:hypothetical protein
MNFPFMIEFKIMLLKRVITAYEMGCTDQTCRHLRAGRDNEVICDRCDSTNMCNEEYAQGTQRPTGGGGQIH